MSSHHYLRSANEFFRKGDYDNAIKLYRLASANGISSALVNFNIELCQRRISSKLGEGTVDIRSSMEANRPTGEYVPTATTAPPKVTITLTTISPRLAKIGQVIESLHKQTVMPDRILLNISTAPYLLDQGISADDPRILKLREFPLLQINWVNNIGPYRKIFPLLQEHFSNTVTEDKIFITVDDDTIYPDTFVATLLDAHLTHDCVVAFRGRHVEVDEATIKPYSAWTLGSTEARLSNLPTGKDGVIYNTKYFTRDFLNLEDALALAPTADDLWIRWHCALNGVRAIVLNPEACTSDYKSFPVVDYSKEYRDVSLYATHNSATSKGKNDRSVEGLEDYFLNRWGYNMHFLIRQH